MTETHASVISDAAGGDRRQMRRRAGLALVALLLVALVAVLAAGNRGRACVCGHILTLGSRSPWELKLESL